MRRLSFFRASCLKGPLAAGILALVALAAAPTGAAAAKPDQVLVEIPGGDITVAELEQALASSPFAVQFNTLGQKEQAALRGMMLKRLVAAHLMRLEARARGLAEQDSFRQEVADFRKGLLYRQYMDKLRAGIALPADDQKALHRKFKDNPDAFAAARSAAQTRRYRQKRVEVLQNLRTRFHVQLFEERIAPGMGKDTVLLSGDGLSIRQGDLAVKDSDSAKFNIEAVKDSLYQKAELELIAKAAEAEGLDVAAPMRVFVEERLPSLLREQLARKWITGPDALRDYYKTHPEIGRIPERWHAGQIVLKTRAEAERLHAKISAGDSLFKLAGVHSIDPYGKAHNGDMGWIRQGGGFPQIEAAMLKLEPGKISDIIETPKGFHIVTVLEKKKGQQLSFEAVKAKLRQALIEEKMTAYLSGLQAKYDIKWRVLEPGAQSGTPKS